MKITICSSAAFYKEANEVKNNLKKLGHKVTVPVTARKMEKSNNYKVADYKVWYSDPKFYFKKAALMKKHFKEVEKSEAILVINLLKNGVKNYIGGNVLMEMAIAFYLGKKIYLLNPVPKIAYQEEILGFMPIVINGHLEKIT